MTNLLSILLQAQVEVQPASTNKFEVVVAVVAVLFIGIVAYLVSIDRKLKKLEDK